MKCATMIEGSVELLTSGAYLIVFIPERIRRGDRGTTPMPHQSASDGECCATSSGRAFLRAAERWIGRSLPYLKMSSSIPSLPSEPARAERSPHVLGAAGGLPRSQKACCPTAKP